MKVLFIFVDGVGIGRKDCKNNPFFFTELPALKKLLGGQLPSLRNKIIHSDRALLIPADARMGVEGLPQSGTGQTALFCGINAAKIIGKHFGPYPYSDLKPYIKEHSVFQQVINRKKKVCFANAYPKRFFEYIASGHSRFTFTSFSCMVSGVPLLKYEDLIDKKGISADITAEGWNKFGYDLLPRDPFKVGKTLYSIALKNDYTLFEYFLTDHAGHSQKKDFASSVLMKFDGLLAGIMDKFDKEKLFIVISSDHGNIENLTVKTHTLNPVPVILIGKNRNRYAEKIKSIVDVNSVVLDIIK